MTKVIAVLFIFVFTISSSVAQNRTDTITANTYFSMNISSPFGVAPRWNFGYLITNDERWQTEFSLGYGARKVGLPSFLIWSGYNSDEYKLWEMRYTIFYNLSSRRKTGDYLSLELFYINHFDVLTDFFYYEASPAHNTYYDQADFRKEKYGINILFNVISNEQKPVMILVYFGPGLRVREHRLTNIENPVTRAPEHIFDGWLGLNNDSKANLGTKVGFNFNLGVKLFIRL